MSSTKEPAKLDHIYIGELSWKDGIDIKKCLFEICSSCHYLFGATLCIHFALNKNNDITYVNPFSDISMADVTTFSSLLESYTDAYSIIIHSGENKYHMFNHPK